jgi:hypothetical protein
MTAMLSHTWLDEKCLSCRDHDYDFTLLMSMSGSMTSREVSLVFGSTRCCSSLHIFLVVVFLCQVNIAIFEQGHF